MKTFPLKVFYFSSTIACLTHHYLLVLDSVVRPLRAFLIFMLVEDLTFPCTTRNLINCLNLRILVKRYYPSANHFVQFIVCLMEVVMEMVLAQSTSLLLLGDSLEGFSIMRVLKSIRA